MGLSWAYLFFLSFFLSFFLPTQLFVSSRLVSRGETITSCLETSFSVLCTPALSTSTLHDPFGCNKCSPKFIQAFEFVIPVQRAAVATEVMASGCFLVLGNLLPELDHITGNVTLKGHLSYAVHTEDLEAPVFVSVFGLLLCR